MKKIFTSLLCSAMFATSFAQWSPATMHGEKLKPTQNSVKNYALDINALRGTLSKAEETGKSAKPVIVSLPTIDGKIEKFAVYSFPVVVKSLADKYQLGSYVGVGIDDPTKYVRFSVAPNDFQSMMIKNGEYQFIEPQNKDKSVYGIHEKTVNSGNKAFVCSTSENAIDKKELDKMFSAGKSFANQPTNFSKNSDKKYRTMRLAMSVTGEYTTKFGSVAAALVQINATMTRVNGVFENDFALHLNLQDFPQLIYTDAATDPYSPASTGAQGAWNAELQNTLTTVIGNATYDIGHLFGASGGGGNAGCIGCVCVDDTASLTDKNKGSGFTSPADANPFGDNFDIDYVAHEMGHQLGGNHTFSHQLEGTGVNVEPGSGSTIMGYAGITGANTDVQPHSDAYFSFASIDQIQANLIEKTCDVETVLTNNPPVITALPNVTIPKSTAFVLTAVATDPENDPITYSWEEADNASVGTSKTNLGNTTTGASFRSGIPNASPTRFFPKTSIVYAGLLKDVNQWEAVSTVAKASKYRVTVRDNNMSSPGFQQTQTALQNVAVGPDGPFIINSAKIYNNTEGPFSWNVAATNNAPYNSPTVKIDYSTDNGATWTVVAASTPNDGTENIRFNALATGSAALVRISSIGNVFYAVKSLTAAVLPLCDGTPPANLVAANLTSTSATLSWDAVANATYVLRYRVIGATAFTTVNVTDTNTTLTGLNDTTQYEAQIAAVCSGTTGTFSASTNFTTPGLTYCTVTGGNSGEEYISNVTVTPEGAAISNNTSGATPYSNFANDATKTVFLAKGTTNNTISVTKMWQGSKYSEAVKVWIDFNRDGVYTASELVMSTVANQTTPVTATFAVPADAYTGPKTVGMRVMMRYNAAPVDACTSFNFGEIEDYAVKISATLGTDESNGKTQGIQVYPNPAVDVLNVTKVSNNAAYSIYNVAGQIVAKGKVLDNKVPVTKLEKGVYIITVDNNGETAKVKFIKK